MKGFSMRNVIGLCGVVYVLAGCAGATTLAPPTGLLPKLTVVGALQQPASAVPLARGEAVVELRDVSAPDGLVVAESRLAVPGANTTAPFLLTVDRAALVKGKSYALQGAVLDGAVATAVTRPVPIDVGTANRVDVGALELEPFQAEAFPSTLQCGDQTIRVGFMQDMMLLTVDGKTWEMHQVPGQKGDVFEAKEDASTRVTFVEDQVQLVLRGTAYLACVQAASS